MARLVPALVGSCLLPLDGGTAGRVSRGGIQALLSSSVSHSLELFLSLKLVEDLGGLRGTREGGQGRAAHPNPPVFTWMIVSSRIAAMGFLNFFF